MAVYKEEKTNTWRAVYRYTDWNGERKQTQKRGFKTKREAQAWEREQLNKASADLDMTFKSFVDLYTADMKTRLKENTWATKDHIIRTKLLPYFGRLKMCNITAQQIITWQNEMLNHKDENGKPYSPVYLKTVHNQLSAIFNHAVRYYNLRENPCKKAGSMGKKKNREMMFWTKEQYLKFAEVMMDKPLSFYAFEMLPSISLITLLFASTSAFVTSIAPTTLATAEISPLANAVVGIMETSIVPASTMESICFDVFLTFSTLLPIVILLSFCVLLVVVPQACVTCKVILTST